MGLLKFFKIILAKCFTDLKIIPYLHSQNDASLAQLARAADL